MSFLRKITKEEITNEHTKNLSPFLQQIKNTKYTKDQWNYPIHTFLQESDITINPRESEICQFLSRKCIFITGATGYLGKVLVEKLLRACIDIDTLYLLVRKKKGIVEDERIQNLLNDIVFTNLSDMHSNFKSKIKAVYGDIGLPNLDLSDVDRKTLTENVNIIFHVAATTRFDEKLRRAVDINLKGTIEIINLGKECQHLESLVYVGTAYSNCNEPQIEERIYKASIKPEELITIVNSFDDDQLAIITPSILKGAPNTYTLTKQVAEEAIKNNAGGLPISIFRPSIVFGSKKEPMKGYSDNIYSGIGLMVAVAVGIIRCTPVNKDLIMDLVPVDYVINASIACSYETYKNRNSKKINVYNYTSYNDNPLKVTYPFELADTYVRHIGSVNMLWFPFLIGAKSEWAYFVLRFLLHRVPCFIVDTGLNLAGKPKTIGGMPARLNYVYKKIDKLTDSVKFFSLREFHFENVNVRKLWDSLNPQDKKNFNFDMKDVDWEEYFLNMGLGSRMYITNEPLDNLEEGRRHLTKLYYAHNTLKIILFSLLAYLICKLVLCIF